MVFLVEITRSEQVWDDRMLTEERRNRLLDLVRQRGYPFLFWTWSPYEYVMPYHEFIRDEIAGPLGLHYYCGMPLEAQSRHDFADMAQIPTLYNACSALFQRRRYFLCFRWMR